jgi:hypothetical protein
VQVVLENQCPSRYYYVKATVPMDPRLQHWLNCSETCFARPILRTIFPLACTDKQQLRELEVVRLQFGELFLDNSPSPIGPNPRRPQTFAEDNHLMQGARLRVHGNAHHPQ